jgi:hypothetical protein
MAKSRKTPAATLPDILKFNPHIFWDPIPPWVDLDKNLANEITKIRLEHQREVVQLQQRAIDKALNVVAKAGR